MPSNKEYNVKLNRLQNTRKMTRTMKLVSMSKLIKAQEAQRRSKFYAEQLTDLISRLAATLKTSTHPLFSNAGKKKQALILLITSDRGLAGGFNNTLIRGVNAWIEKNQANYERVEFSFAGRRGYMFFRNKFTVKENFIGVTAKPDFLNSRKIGENLSEEFIKGEYTDVFVAYNKFKSPLAQTPIIEKILPIEPKPLLYPPVADRPNAKMPSGYIFEPEADQLLSSLIPRYLYFMIYFALLENSAGEHGARMTAMDSATKNAEDLIERFTLMRNRARQASITGELIEIVSGAEALNQ